MRINKLLYLSMAMGCGLAAQAQTPVFHESFDGEQKAPEAVGFYEQINLQEGDVHSVVSNGFIGKGYNMFNNPDYICENQAWQRAIKFRNLPLQEGKTYRLNFKLKGSNTYTNADGAEAKTKAKVSLMQGGENADIELMDADGNKFGYEISYLNPSDFEDYTRMFHFASADLQKQKYAEANPDKEPLADKFFATFNVFNPGDFTLDEIDLVESNIQDFTAGGTTIRINFGFGTNIAKLAGANSNGVVILPNDVAKVKVAGEDAAIEAVELHKDGYLYIFLEETSIEAATELEVSFNNAEGESQIAYQGTLAPKGAVPSFSETFKAYYDESLADVYSFAWAPAKMISASPADGSFALPESIKEFTIKLDHQVYTIACTEAEQGADVDAPVAKIGNNTLTVKEGTPQLTDEVTFVLPAGVTLKKGSYDLVVSGLWSDKFQPSDNITVSFETGEVQLAKTEYTLQVDGKTQLEAEGGIPTGWTLMVGENVHGGGSGARGFIYTNSNVQSAFYLRDWDGHAVATASPVAFPKGEVELRSFVAGWGTSGTFIIKVKNAAGEEVVNKEVQIEAVLEKNRQGDFQIVPVRFNSDGGEYTYSIELKDGSNELLSAGYEVYTFTETEGDKFEPEVVLESGFSGANMPAEGTGWLFYNDNSQLTPGSGRNGTSGMLERNFATKMQSAAFFRECGANENAAHRIEFGNGNGIEGGTEIAAGSYEIVYYAGTWNDNGGNEAGTSKVFMQIIDAQTEEVVFSSEHVNVANFQNGNAINGQADKVTEKFNCPGGKYIIKAWGTTNTVWGALTITKEGSLAAKWYSKIIEAATEAQAVLDQCAEDKYNGTAKTELTDVINKYITPTGVNTEAQATSIINDINAKKEAMAERRAKMADYEDVMSKIGDLLNKIDTENTKFQRLDSYKNLVADYTKYNGTEASTLENAVLIPVTESLLKNYNLLNSYYNDCVALLTKQIAALTAKLIEIDPTAESEQIVIDGRDAVYDHQGIADMLQKKLTLAIYKKLAGTAEEKEAFWNTTSYDAEDNPIVEPKTHDLSGYIQNAGCYVVTEAPRDTQLPITAWPGWQSDNSGNFFKFAFGWDNWGGSATHPVTDGPIEIGWTTSGANVWNDIKNLPAGIYNIGMKTMDRSGVNEIKDEDGNTSYGVTIPERFLSKVWYQTGEKTDSVEFDISSIGQYYGFSECTIPNVTINNGTLRLGAYIHAYESFAGIDDARLELIAPDPNFDYAAAIAAIEEEIKETGAEEIVPEGEVLSVEYFTLDGKKTTNIVGKLIEVAHYKNCFKARKVVK